MHNAKSKRKIFLVILTVLCLVGVFSAVVFAANQENQKTDAMTEINKNLSSYKLGEVEIKNDGSIGIPVNLTVFFDSKNTFTDGHHGTPVILYSVNTNTERVGEDSDTVILQSMLDRGYAVIVMDYKNSPRAVAPDIEKSNLKLKCDFKNGDYLGVFPIFKDKEILRLYNVKEGFNITVDYLFWECDKHSVDGTFDETLRIWNNDFKALKGEKLVKWVYPDGTRKPTDNGAVWYNSNGNQDANGEYTKVKFTAPTDVTELCNPDGSPLDYDLRMDIIYPTTSVEVPLMILSSSSTSKEYTTAVPDRPQFIGFNYRGYATAVYDYLYVPMAREDSFGYFDGNDAGNKTGDPLTYSLQLYNSRLIDTAAMRCLRYLSMSSTKYNFKNDCFGVYGVSKGGATMFLGESYYQQPLFNNVENLQGVELDKAIDKAISSYKSLRDFEGHHGETRYQNGITETINKNGYIIEPGEVQPFLTYNGKEILSGVQFQYQSCANCDEDLTYGHCPIYISCNLGDYGSCIQATYFVQSAREHDVPALYFTVKDPHTFARSRDVDYNVDTYLAFFEFADYYLNDKPIKLCYMSPVINSENAKGDSVITLKFYGEATASEMEKVTVKNQLGEVLAGTWVSSYGGTEWRFIGDGLDQGCKYTVNIPANFKGTNGLAIGEDVNASFFTEKGVVSNVLRSEVLSDGVKLTFNVPSLQEVAMNGYKIRIAVKPNCHNSVNVYGVLPASDELIGTVYLDGNPYFEIDVSEFILKNGLSGEVSFKLKDGKVASENVIYNNDFATSLDSTVIGAYTNSAFTTINGNKGLKISVTPNTGTNKVSPFYNTPTVIFENGVLVKNGAITEEDYGRHFTVSVKLYDTVSRRLTVRSSPIKSSGNLTVDYDAFFGNFDTKANEITTFTFDYVVYGSKFGDKGLKNINFEFMITPDGNNESPVYLLGLTSVEKVDKVEFDVENCGLVCYNNVELPYKAPTSTHAFAVYNGGSLVGEYDSFASAMGAYVSGQTLKLQSNYIFRDGDGFNMKDLSGDVNIDLNGYKIVCLNESESLLLVSSINNKVLNINVTNGGIVLKDKALIEYAGSNKNGDSKVINLNLENVAVDVLPLADINGIISAKGIESGVYLNTYITLKNCKINVNTLNLVNLTADILPLGEGALALHYKVLGGEIAVDSLLRVNVKGDFKNTMFGEVDGQYPLLVLPNSEVPNGSGYKAINQPTMIYGNGVKGERTTVYSLVTTDLSTKYGIIPEEYRDAELYPLISFNGQGEVIYAGRVFAKDNPSMPSALGIMTKGRVYDSRAMVLRADYVYDDVAFNNYSFIMGDFVIDLNGHTLTNNRKNSFIKAQAKWEGVTNMTLVNGRFVVGSAPVIEVSSATNNSYNGSKTKTFGFNFKDVVFDFGNTVAPDVFGRQGSSTVRVNSNFDFENCTFNFKENVTSPFTLLNLGSDNGNNVSHGVIRGGKIVGQNVENLTLFGVNNSASDFVCERDLSNEYLTLELPNSAKAPVFTVPTSEGDMVFAKAKEVGGVATYTLKAGGTSTEYGLIPEEYADVTAYPFVFFDGKGNFEGASNMFYGEGDVKSIVHLAKNFMQHNTKTQDGTYSQDGIQPVILLRRDYDYSGEHYYNLAQIVGTMKIDLGGHTMTLGSEMFPASSKTHSGNTFDTKVIVTNGNLVVGDRGVVRFSPQDAEKNFAFEFDDVNFSLKSGSKATRIISYFAKDGSSKDVNFNAFLTLKNCTIDIRNATNKITVFDANDTTTHNNSKVSVPLHAEIYGCTLIANDGDKFDLANVSGSNGSSVTFNKFAGDYLTVKLNSGAANPNLEIVTDSGVQTLTKSGVDGGFDVYKVGIVTKYGVIPAEFADAEMYPFAIFDKNGNFLNAAKVFYGNQVKDSAFGIAYRSSVDCVILMRSDYLLTTKEHEDNLSATKAIVTLDLGGHVLTSTHDEIFRTPMKPSLYGNKMAQGNLVIENGTLELKHGSVLRTEVWDSQADKTNIEEKVFNITFNNITFKVGADSSTTNLLIRFIKNKNTPDAHANPIININDCKIDLRGRDLSKKITLVQLKDKNAVVTLNIKGLEILADSLNNVKLFDVNSSVIYNYKGKDYKQTVKFSGSLDNVLKIVLPKSENKPLEVPSFGINGSYIKSALGDSNVWVLCDLNFVKDKKVKEIDRIFNELQRNNYFDSDFYTLSKIHADTRALVLGYTDADLIDKFDIAEFEAALMAVKSKGDYASDAAFLSALNISLKGDVGINFRFTVNEEILKKYSNPYITFAMPDGKTVVLYFKDAERDSESRAVFTVSVAAAEMNDKVNFKIVLDEGVFGYEYSYSVRDYADLLFATPEIEQKYPGVGELVKAMLNYGGYAQKYFKHNENNLANEGIFGSDDPVLGDVTENSNIAIVGSCKGIHLSKWTVSLQSDLVFRLYFALDSGADMENYTFNLTRPDGKRVNLVPVIDEGYLRIDVSPISAPDLDSVFKLEVLESGGTNTVIDFSAVCYVGKVLSDSSASVELKNLVKALKLYSDASNVYKFGN